MYQTWEDWNGNTSLKVHGVPGRYVMQEEWDEDKVWMLTEYTATVIAKTLGLGYDIFIEVLPNYLPEGEWIDD
jgi:hypothetical protein